MKCLICACCGTEIKGTFHGPYGSDKYVCERCWSDPCLFFPDKINFALSNLLKLQDIDVVTSSNVAKFINLFRRNLDQLESNIMEVWKAMGAEMLEIDAIRLTQKGMPMYVGKIKAADLLTVSAIEQWSEESLDGFQREKFREKTREIKEYLENCPIAMIPSLLASFREGSFSSINHDFGILRLPRRPNAISLLDGQQRTGGFNEIFAEIQELQQKGPATTQKEEEKDLARLRELMEYEIPIVLIDSKAIATKLSKEIPTMANVRPTDVEGAFFFIVNKTQKPVNPSLKDELAYKTFAAGITGIPIIEKEKWRTEVVPIANALNRDVSPLRGLINLGGIRGLGRPIRLNSFVTSLKPLFVNNDAFRKLSQEKKKAFLKSYWTVVREIFPYAFNEDTRKDFLILKTIGVYALNHLADDIFSWCVKAGKDPIKEDCIREYLMPLKDFNWRKRDSELAYLGGQKGVIQAHKILLKALSDKGIIEAKDRYDELNQKNQ